jgi:hypothetical protein
MGNPLNTFDAATRRYIKNAGKLVDGVFQQSSLWKIREMLLEEEDDFDKFVRETREAAGIPSPPRNREFRGGVNIAENIIYTDPED